MHAKIMDARLRILLRPVLCADGPRGRHRLRARPRPGRKRDVINRILDNLHEHLSKKMPAIMHYYDGRLTLRKAVSTIDMYLLCRLSFLHGTAASAAEVWRGAG